MKHNTFTIAYRISYTLLSVILVAVLFYPQAGEKAAAQTTAASTASVATAVSTAANNASVQELQRKIEERNRTIEKLTKEIKEYQDLADKTSQEAQSLQRSIKQLETNGKALDLDIKRIKEKIDAASMDITRLSIVISESEQTMQLMKDAIAQNIKDISERDQTGIVELFLAKKSLSGFVNEVDQLFQINKNLKELNEKLETEKKKSEQNKKSELDKKNELVKLQSELTGKKKVVEYNKSEQTKILVATKNDEKTYQQLLKEKQATKAAFEKEIFEYESQLKYKGDPSKIPKAGSGALTWPVDNVIITQRFGKTVAAKRLYVSGSHNGVDFGVRLGTPVKAMGSGVVMGAGDTDITCPGASFGRWILLKFDNGLAATYGHLSVISVSQGQVVNVGDVIGYSGNTGYSTGPHLHISMYPANGVQVQNRPSASCGGRIYTMPIAAIEAYLDPMVYLPQ